MKGDAFKGVILLDKPAGISSHDAARKAANMLSAKKAGHTGTLDMGVTGLLVVCLGEARKAMPLLAGMEKEYEGTMHLHGDVSREMVEGAVKEFRGKIIQTPPRKSRVARRPREREITAFEITGLEGRDCAFRVKCQAGTYIRKLVSDLGDKLGCGAHMAQLRRVSVGPFSVKEAAELEKVGTGDIINLEEALERAGARKVRAKAEALERVRNGIAVGKGDAEGWTSAAEGEKVGIYSGKEIIAIGTAGKDSVKVDRVFNKQT